MNPNVAVLNLGHSALGIARALAPLGAKVTVFAKRTGDIGAGSRYLRVCSAPDSAEDGGAPLRDFLIRYAACCPSRPILFPTRDLDVGFIDGHRHDLVRHFAIAQPAHDILDLIINKTRLAEAAANFGIATPRTLQFDAATPDPVRLPDNLNYPLIIRAIYAHEPHAKGISVGKNQVKAHIAESSSDAIRQAKRLLDEGISIFIQEFIAGSTDRLVICAGYVGVSEKYTRVFTARKLLQYPEAAGIGQVVETTNQPELAKSTIAFLRHLGFRGIFEAEFKLDPRGVPQLIEVNPRHWDQHRLGSARGVDVSILATEDLLGARSNRGEHFYRRAVWYDDPFVMRLTARGDPIWRQLQTRLKHDAEPAHRIDSIFSLSDPVPALRIYSSMAIEILVKPFRPLVLRGTSRNRARAP